MVWLVVGELQATCSCSKEHTCDQDQSRSQGNQLVIQMISLLLSLNSVVLQRLRLTLASVVPCNPRKCFFLTTPIYWLLFKQAEIYVQLKPRIRRERFVAMAIIRH